MAGRLEEDEINSILLASGKQKRMRKRPMASLMPGYEAKLRMEAKKKICRVARVWSRQERV